MKPVDVLVLNNIGGGFDILVKRLPNPHETIMMKQMRLTEDLAKGGNVAVALARLGVSCAIIGKIGDDEAGKRDLGWMQAAGVDTGEVLVSPDVATGQGIGIIAENGDNILITGESSSEKLTWEEVQAAMLRRRGAGYFITGLEVRMPLVLRAIQLAKQLGMPVSQVQMVCDLIRTLEPKPGRSFASDENVKYIVPDVFVEKVDGEYVVFTNEYSIPHLMVSPYYTTLSKETKNDEEVSKYLTDKFNSALWLIKSIEQRRQTIFNVVTAVVVHQKEFLDKGPKYLKTLTLKQVADVMGVHESTVSRSINGKYMQTPRGVFEIRYFFSSGVTGHNGEGMSSNSIKTFIKEIIDGEDPKKPYSDQEMVEILSERGIEISRRTVAKYREGMNILSSSKRRRYEI